MRARSEALCRWAHKAQETTDHHSKCANSNWQGMEGRDVECCAGQIGTREPARVRTHHTFICLVAMNIHLSMFTFAKKSSQWLWWFDWEWPYELICLDAWSPGGAASWEGLGGASLGVGFVGLFPLSPLPAWFLCLLHVDQGVSSSCLYHGL